MLVHCRATSNIKFASTYLYTWVERGTVRVKCLAQEHDAKSPAQSWTWTAQSWDEHSDHDHMFTLASQLHSHYTRNCNLYYIPLGRTNIRNFSIQFQGPKFFNSLSPEIQNTESIRLFGKRLKNSFFLSQVYSLLSYLTNRMWFSMGYSLIDNDTCHHSGQNVVDSWGAAEWVRNKCWPLWWRVSLSIRLYTMLNHIRFAFYHNIKKIFCLDNWKHRLRFESARAALCKWAACTRQTFLSKTFANLLNM